MEALVADPAATGGLYGTRPAVGGNKAAKLRAIREALRTAKRVWLATDCDREGQLHGQEILEHSPSTVAAGSRPEGRLPRNQAVEV